MTARRRSGAGAQSSGAEDRGKQQPLRHHGVQRPAPLEEARQPLRDPVALLRSNQRRRLPERGNGDHAVLELRSRRDGPAAARRRRRRQRQRDPLRLGDDAPAPHRAHDLLRRFLRRLVAPAPHGRHHGDLAENSAMHRAECGERGRGIEQRDDLAFVGPESCLGQLQTDLQTEARRTGRPSEPQIVEGGSALAVVRSAQAKLTRLAEEREGPGERPESAGDGAGMRQLEQVDTGARMRQRKLDLALRGELLARRFDVAAELHRCQRQRQVRVGQGTAQPQRNTRRQREANRTVEHRLRRTFAEIQRAPHSDGLYRALRNRQGVKPACRPSGCGAGRRIGPLQSRQRLPGGSLRGQ